MKHLIKQFLEIGQIVGTHGVKGEVRVQPWCDSPAFITQFHTLYYDADGRQPVTVLQSRAHGNIALLRLAGVESLEQAQAMRGQVLFMRRADAKLADGAYFLQELFGCKVYDADTGVFYGELTDVSETGANDVWHITKEKAEYLLPAIREVVVQVDVAAEKILIRPMRGIFDEAVYAD